MGIRLTNSTEQWQVWARQLANGDVAVGLLNRGGDGGGPPILPCSPTTKYVVTNGGYYNNGAGADNVGSFNGLTVAQAEKACCGNPRCAGFSFKGGAGFYKANAVGGLTKAAGYTGYTKPGQIAPPKPPASNTADITVSFGMPGINLGGKSVAVYDIWAGKTVGTFQTSYTAKAVPYHGTAFLRLSAQ
eukprot:SAG22_NODE_1173_length_5253_cov_4.401436_4_plen_188_part_00